MRIARWTVYNKENGKAMFSHCNRFECKAFIAKQENQENFVIGYRQVCI